MAPTILESRTDFSSSAPMCFEDSLHPCVGGLLLLRLWNARVYYWYGRITAGGRPWQLAAALSCARLRPRAESLKTAQWTPTSCAPTVVTGGRSLSVQETILPRLSWQSETQCNICFDQRHQTHPDTSLSADTAIMYTLSDIWTDDFYKVGELQLSENAELVCYLLSRS